MIMTTMRRVVDILSEINKYIISALLAAMTIVVVVSITMRYVFNRAPSWSEEVTKYIFIYLIFLAAAQGVRYQVHVRIDTLERRLNGIPKKALRATINGLLLLFLVVLTVYGFKLVGATMRQASPALGIPMGVAYLAIPIGTILSMIFMAFPDDADRTSEELSV